MQETPRLALVTGVTGYVGRRLVRPLLDAGWRVRVLTRDTVRIADEPWFGQVEVVEGDVGRPAALRDAVTGTDAAYYLVHSMNDSYDYAARDRMLAGAFAAACGDAGTARIVYLGALYPAGEKLSTHLESRREVGEILLAAAVPATVLQAGMVVGAGSASFDLLRLVDRLPVVIAPTWLSNHVQPIALDDVLHYLVGSADMPPEADRAFDIGGPDIVSYRELIGALASASGKRVPPIIVVPVLLPRTASLWAGILAPGSSTLNGALVHSLTLDMECADHDIADYVADPPGGLAGVRDAIDRALADIT